MRILGYSKKWPKLQKEIHTTFRFTRKDKDWQVGEYIQEVFHPRNKDREVINPIAQIIDIHALKCIDITQEEAIEDGFSCTLEMLGWLLKAHGDRVNNELIHKLEIKVITPEIKISEVSHDSKTEK